MVKKFEPAHKWYQYEDEPALVMKESSSGEYVQLETYNHEMKRKDKQIERLQDKIKEYEEKLVLLASQDSNLEISITIKSKT